MASTVAPAAETPTPAPAEALEKALEAAKDGKKPCTWKAGNSKAPPCTD